MTLLVTGFSEARTHSSQKHVQRTSGSAKATASTSKKKNQKEAASKTESSARTKSSARSKISAKASTRGKSAAAAKPCKRGKKCKASTSDVVVARRPRGQQIIDSDRTREIQAALIRERYLEGEPTGEFDDRTREALKKFQSDNGWQSKVVPDSRALIKLGLGPSRDGLLNPESAVLSPHELGAKQEAPGGSVTRSITE